jgi:hypothetical protein
LSIHGCQLNDIVRFRSSYSVFLATRLSVRMMRNATVLSYVASMISI